MHSVLKLNQDDVKKVVHKNFGRKQPTDYSNWLNSLKKNLLLSVFRAFILLLILPRNIRMISRDCKKPLMICMLSIKRTYLLAIAPKQRQLPHSLLAPCIIQDTSITVYLVGSAIALSFVKEKLNADLSFILWNKLPNGAPYTAVSGSLPVVEFVPAMQPVCRSVPPPVLHNPAAFSNFVEPYRKGSRDKLKREVRGRMLGLYREQTGGAQADHVPYKQLFTEKHPTHKIVGWPRDVRTTVPSSNWNLSEVRSIEASLKFHKINFTRK
ncbi:hypothetical protein BDF20DRAFT_903478 [Mycotypha africana]|uniref:uncharacterized protein n=1 Tax=Mycotypha africana TaxID=64632 RepID=UPI0023003772|nr:uncharacterized protein BDF20DRAFT_903478 [Mycotypha africana]KAI8966966.1 hypothetical protein BDF20DRAFT_903478 [Mycotypha africana]